MFCKKVDGRVIHALMKAWTECKFQIECKIPNFLCQKLFLAWEFLFPSYPSIPSIMGTITIYWCPFPRARKERKMWVEKNLEIRALEMPKICMLEKNSKANSYGLLMGRILSVLCKNIFGSSKYWNSWGISHCESSTNSRRNLKLKGTPSTENAW